MSIERVNIQTPNFSFRATHIRGNQLQNILNNLLRSSGSTGAGDSGAARLGSGSTGPGAIQSPAERFQQVQSPTSTGRTPATDGTDSSSPTSSSPSDPTSGFASGGSSDMRSLDSNQMMQTIMQLLERLLQALFQMLGQQGGGEGAGDGAGQGGGCGGAGSSTGAGGAGGPGTCGDGSGMPSTPLDSTTSNPTTSNPTTSTPTTGGGAGGGSSTSPTGTTSTPPRNGHVRCSPHHSRNTRARPHHRGDAIRRIFQKFGKGAAAAAPLVPGGAAARAGANVATRLLGGGRNDGSVIDRSGPRPYSANGGATPTKPDTLASRSSSSSSSSSSLGGGSFEDRLFNYLGALVKQSENELDNAMKQGQSGGGQGDSQTLASQRVQQLVQKRSELVQTLTNTTKTFHESTQAVTSNLK